MILLRKLAKSKKLAALVLGVVGAVISRVGLDPALAEPVSQIVVALVGVYMVSQGVADHGKEAAKVKAVPIMRNPRTGGILGPDDKTPDPEVPK